MHIEICLADVPAEERCKCPRDGKREAEKPAINATAKDPRLV